MSLSRFTALLKTGLTEWPEVYGGVGYFTVGFLGTVYLLWRTEKENDYVIRYKKIYMIMRPNDERVKLYPADYVTDSHYLPRDHPQIKTDVRLRKLGPIDNHREPF